MWQRFTERARKVVFYAQEAAQKFGSGYVSTEHLLIGLCREPDSTAELTLERLGTTANRVRAEIEKQLPWGDARTTQDMTLTPRAKRVIDLAYDEARNLNNNYIGTEHLLLGLVRESDGLAGRVLSKLGIDLERTRRAVLGLQDVEGSGSSPEPRPKRLLSYEPTYGFFLGACVCEHIVLAAIASEESICGKAVRNIITDVSTVQGLVWGQIRKASQKGVNPVGPDELDALLRGANAEARSMGANTIQPHHLILAATRMPHLMVMSQIFERSGLTYEKLRIEIEMILSEGPTEGSDSSSP